jgi:hypothetical protein
MKKIFGLIAIAAMFLLMSTSSASAFYFDLQDLGGGDYEVWYIGDGTPSFDTDGMTLVFDYTGALGTVTPNPYMGYPTMFGGVNLPLLGTNDLGDALAITFAQTSGVGTFTADIQIAAMSVAGGTLAWDYDNSSGAFLVNLVPGVETTGDVLNDLGYLNPPGGGTVPIPGAVFLLASGLIGLIGLRRKV